MAEVKQITEGISLIHELWSRRVKIKETIKELQDEDREIVEKLNERLGVNLQSEKGQTFECGTLILTANPQIYRTVKTEEALKLISENEKAKEHSDVFRTKLEIALKNWKSLSLEDQAIFADVVTEKPGKTEYKEVTTKEN